MRNPRITINDGIWSKTRSRAAGMNTTVSSVVEEALHTYLADRNVTMTSGSVTPEFTGAIDGIELTRNPEAGYREVKAVPKPGKKPQAKSRQTGW